MSATVEDIGARATRLSVLVSLAEGAEISRRAEEAGLSVSAYLRAQALGTGLSETETEAMAIFDRLLDDMAARVDAANTGLVAALGRMDAAKAERASG